MLSVIWPFKPVDVSAIIKILLLPITLLYSLVSLLRNALYDIGILKSKSYSYPVITIGNLSVGGTGKTPHTEYIIEQLRDQYRIAVLSRGYKRDSRGFRLAHQGDDAHTIGDEPYQIFKKYEDIMVAVDEKRRRGIAKLRALDPPPEIILLDDAFQHRSVKAGLNILLTDYTIPYTEDLPLPSGRLREPRRGAKRADIIVVTKSPQVLSPLEIRRITSIINPEAYQKVFFSYIDYQKPKPLNEAARKISKFKNPMASYSFLTVSAIANPKPLLLYLQRHAKEVRALNFSDHHFFTEKDYQKINEEFEDIFSNKKAIIITEKDATKIDFELMGEAPLFVLPIKISFHQHEEEDFITEITEYVRSYTGVG